MRSITKFYTRLALDYPCRWCFKFRQRIKMDDGIENGDHDVVMVITL